MSDRGILRRLFVQKAIETEKLDRLLSRAREEITELEDEVRREQSRSDRLAQQVRELESGPDRLAVEAAKQARENLEAVSTALGDKNFEPSVQDFKNFVDDILKGWETR